VWPAHRDVEVVEAEGDVSGVQGDCEAVVDGMVAGDVGGGVAVESEYRLCLG